MRVVRNKINKVGIAVSYALKKNKNVIPLLKRSVHVYKTAGFSGVKDRLNRFYENDSYEKSLTSSSNMDLTLFSYKENYNNLFNLANNITPNYIDYRENDLESYDTRLIAYYLPQFHCFPENDEWWGKGFTEWRNVTKAVPQFLGHNQPILPSDLGFYDLNNDDVLKDQVKIAKNYGISAFCFHYYWFSGQKLMNKPIEKYLKNKQLDLDFCICWANENWTRRWDGNESDVLIGQNHSLEMDSNFILDIEKFIKDERYIKVDGKSLIVVYRPSLIPDIKEVTERWRTHCRNGGLGELHLVMAKCFDQKEPSLYGFDAAVEFPPHQLGEIVSPEPVNYNELLNKSFSGLIFDYNKVVNSKISEFDSQSSDNLYRTVFPSWDNEARKPGRGHIFKDSSPGKYQEWLEGAINYSKNNKVNGESLVFINAWNEWAEGAMLEPTLKDGYSYLNATSNALKRSEVTDFCKKTQISYLNKTDYKENLVILHLYYSELFDELYDSIKNIDSYDIVINFGPDITIEKAKYIVDKFDSVATFIYPNHGRDILPLIKSMKFVENIDYKKIIKIHSKKSKHRIDGDEWRQHLVKSLIGSKANAKANLDRVGKECSLLAPKGHLYKSTDYLGSNQYHFSILSGIKEADVNSCYYHFPAGSMYIADYKDMKQFIEFIIQANVSFEEEFGQVDGTLAHAIERFVGYYYDTNKFKMLEVE